MLLDTHVAVWAILDDPSLSLRARRLIEDPANEIHVSLVTLWEIAVKNAAVPKKSSSFQMSAMAAQDEFRVSGYILLEITAAHIHALEFLPPIHKDPFDRLLLAQAYETPLRLVTQDRTLQRYGDFVLGV